MRREEIAPTGIDESCAINETYNWPRIQGQQMHETLSKQTRWSGSSEQMR